LLIHLEFTMKRMKHIKKARHVCPENARLRELRDLRGGPFHATGERSS
jgi:hypothetical protein